MYVSVYICIILLEITNSTGGGQTSGNLGIRGIDGSRAGEGCCGGVLPRDCPKCVCLTHLKLGHPQIPCFIWFIIIETVIGHTESNRHTFLDNLFSGTLAEVPSFGRLDAAKFYILRHWP